MTDSIKIERHELMLQLASRKGEIEACKFMLKLSEDSMKEALESHNKIVEKINKLDFPCVE